MNKKHEFEKIIYENYEKLLGRVPDEEGLKHFLYLLESKKLFPSELSNIIKNSEEYKILLDYYD